MIVLFENGILVTSDVSETHSSGNEERIIENELCKSL